MVTPRLTVSLSPEERRVLAALCELDKRPPVFAVRWLIAEEAERRGLTPAPQNANGGAMDSKALGAAIPN